MNATEEEAKALGLTEEQLLLFTTPFKNLSKEGTAAAFALADRVMAYRDAENRKYREEQAARSEEERIKALQEDMQSFNNKQPRKFY